MRVTDLRSAAVSALASMVTLIPNPLGGVALLKIVFLLFGIAAGFVTFYRTIVDAEKGE